MTAKKPLLAMESGLADMLATAIKSSLKFQILVMRNSVRCIFYDGITDNPQRNP